MFSWKEIPGNDSAKLIDFLKSNYDVDWVKTAKIAKTDNDKTIMITAGENILSLNLNNKNTDVYLKIDKGKTDKFIVKTEKGNLNIYSGHKIHDVGQKNPNPWGLYDMHGNVDEWVQDKWHNDYSDAPIDGSVWEGSDPFRVIRGVCYDPYPYTCGSATRLSAPPGDRSIVVGFRLLRIS